MIDAEMESSWKFWKKRRIVVAIFIFFGFFISYNLRVNMGVAIIKMTENRTIIDSNGDVHYEQEFDWMPSEKGVVLSSFFYGYMSTQLLGGWLSMKISGKHVFGFGIGVTALLTIFTPLIAKHSTYSLVALRIIEGVVEGITYPSTSAIWSNWAPPLERTKLASSAFSGCFVSIIMSLPICGFMAEQFGWPSLFYFFGVVGILWYICWLVFVSNDPKDDRWISKTELKYIQNSLATVKAEKVHYPWREMFSSPAVWAVMSSQVCETWTLSTMMNLFPTFFHDALDFDLQTSSLLSALPYVVMVIFLIVSGIVADWLRMRKILTTTQVRKSFNTVGFVGQIVFTALASWIMTTKVGIIVCLIAATGLGGISHGVFHVNFLDIAPKQSSLLVGITNTIACIPALASPLVAGFIIKNKTYEEWQTIFLISCIFYVIGTVMYIICGSGELQPWANRSDAKSSIS